MKIALLTDGIYPFVIGGMQKHSFYLAKFLIQQGHELTLVHCVPYGKELPKKEDVLKEMDIDSEIGANIICLHFPKPNWYPGHYVKESYQYSVSVFDMIKDQLSDLDFIYAKGFAGWHLINEKRKGLSAPPIGIKFHGYEMFQPAPSFKVKLEMMMLAGPVKFNHKYTDYVFSYGGKITSLIEGIHVPRTHILEIPTGIEAAWCTDQVKMPKGKRKFLFIGRYERRKGVEELNAVLNELTQENSEFEMHLIGPIPHSKRINHPSIIYHGKIMEKEKIQGIADECDVLVTPSHSEGMPNVIMEGMARGLAVISTDVGAIAAMVGRDNGWLLPPANKELLKQTMQEAIGMDASTLHAKKSASVAKVKSEFTWEVVIQKTEDAIQKVVSAS